jgi:hypothetical protein
LRQARLAQAVALLHDVKQEGFIDRQVLKVAAASQPQVLGDRPFQGAIRRFDVPVLIGTPNMNGARLQAQVSQQLQVLGIVATLGLRHAACLGAQMMSGGGGVVGLMNRRHVAQLGQCALQTEPEGDQ